MSASELEREQRHVDRAYARLEVLRRRARDRAAPVWRQGGGTPQARHDRDAFVRSSLHRLAQLDEAEYGLVFGRLDEDDGDTWHIGRMGVQDEGYQPLVVDWRAPVASAFYRATPLEPLGVRRRRHVHMRRRSVVGIDDELLDTDADRDGDLVLVGEGALLAAVERPRGERMPDIVATIQREQDEVVRAPLPGVTVVQGGPGTGKTAVALHRVAYLLYANRDRIGHLGVLVIGPTTRFLRYIGDVLPGLGEDAVRLARIGDLLGDGLVTATEPADLQRLKGDGRMATVVRRLVRDRRWSRVDGDDGELPETMLRALLGDDDVLRRAAGDVLAEREIARLSAAEAPSGWTDADVALLDEIAAQLARRRPRRRRRARADAARIEETIDVLGLDDSRRAEARERLRRQVEPDWEVREEVYGHVVVDEAQELSAMQWRMLVRRCPSGSMTVVGDLDQGTGPTASTDWDELRVHLPGRLRVRELTINYRTPAEIMEHVATRADAMGTRRRLPRSVRRSGRPPRVVAVDPDEVAATVDAVLVDHVEAPGTAVVIAPEPQVPALSTVGAAVAAVAPTGPPTGPPSPGDRRVDVLSPLQAKGLEFDLVVVVDPDGIAARHGGAALYVALTRSTRDLVVVEPRRRDAQP